MNQNIQCAWSETQDEGMYLDPKLLDIIDEFQEQKSYK